MREWHRIKNTANDPNRATAQNTIGNECATNAMKRSRPTFASKIVANVALTNATTVRFSGGPARIALARFAVNVATSVHVIIHRRMSGFVIGLHLSPTIQNTMAVLD